MLTTILHSCRKVGACNQAGHRCQQSMDYRPEDFLHSVRGRSWSQAFRWLSGLDKLWTLRDFPKENFVLSAGIWVKSTTCVTKICCNRSKRCFVRPYSALPRHPGRTACQCGWGANSCRHRYVVLIGMQSISLVRLTWLKWLNVYNMWVYKIYCITGQLHSTAIYVAVLKLVGLEKWRKKVVFSCADGASVNIGNRTLNSLSSGYSWSGKDWAGEEWGRYSPLSHFRHAHISERSDTSLWIFAFGKRGLLLRAMLHQFLRENIICIISQISQI